jgi:hypothetical protein
MASQAPCNPSKESELPMISRPLVRVAVALTAGVGLAAVVCSPAGAAAPDRFPLEFHGTGTVDCGTFQDNYIDDFYGEASTFYDSAGEPSRVVIHWTHTSTDSNSVTGLTLHEHGQFTENIDLLAGTDTYTGSQEILNRPGYGVIIQDTGRQVYDANGNLIFFAGGRKHSEVIQGDELFCDGLA